MENWVVALICFGVAVFSVLIVSAVKFIAKKNAEKKGETMDMKKAEFPLALTAFILAFCGVAAFLYFYIKLQIGAALGSATLYGFTTEGIYILVIQLARKGIKGAIKSILEIVGKLKKSKNPIAELPGIVEDTANEDQQQQEASPEEIGKQIFETIFKKDGK